MYSTRSGPLSHVPLSHPVLARLLELAWRSCIEFACPLAWVWVATLRRSSDPSSSFLSSPFFPQPHFQLSPFPPYSILYDTFPSLLPSPPIFTTPCRPDSSSSPTLPLSQATTKAPSNPAFPPGLQTVNSVNLPTNGHIHLCWLAGPPEYPIQSHEEEEKKNLILLHTALPDPRPHLPV